MDSVLALERFEGRSEQEVLADFVSFGTSHVDALLALSNADFERFLRPFVRFLKSEEAGEELAFLLRGVATQKLEEGCRLSAGSIDLLRGALSRMCRALESQARRGPKFRAIRSELEVLADEYGKMLRSGAE
jgi:hypothetical protein